MFVFMATKQKLWVSNNQHEEDIQHILPVHITVCKLGPEGPACSSWPEIRLMFLNGQTLAARLDTAASVRHMALLPPIHTY